MARKNLRRFMDNVSGSATFIGEGTTFVGEFSGPGHFIVCGTVEGDSELEGPLTVAIGGHWKGSVRATDIIVAGSVDGDVRATGRLEVATTARIHGSLSGPSIAVAEGAIVEGRIDMMGPQKLLQYNEKRSGDPGHGTQKPTAAQAGKEKTKTSEAKSPG